ncbi:hypothetical protein BDN71DRAFT_1503855 [Pleurotus eryngii]|uniref:Uncharacterized protein n=1 Tax=Pleurotus eryngii TaxID=5323 RepID=A0A9P6A3U0_PLEER|nr:hypothetical protein BDN71DRAFT_1503855 [Pleurotus eryngii]
MSDRAANELGGYMLQGWILTDRTCPTSGCKWPLLRSPKDQSSFCANCDVKPGQSALTTVLDTPTSSRPSSASHASRSSTPPTEVSMRADSPEFELSPESEASRRRREQSDRASSEIGKRLLKGWAMLAEECPNTDCYGVPLVRPPSSTPGIKDPRMECVVCTNVYVSEVDSRGFSVIVPFATQTEVQPSHPITSNTTGRLTSEQASHTEPPVIAPPPKNETIAQELPPPPESYLSSSVQALERTMATLSQRLGSVQGDPNAIGITADAITKTAQALTMVRQLQWSERQNTLGWSQMQ